MLRSVSLFICATLAIWAGGCRPPDYEAEATVAVTPEQTAAQEAAQREEDKAAEEAAKKATFEERDSIKLTGAAAIKQMTAICVDAQGRLFICDAAAQRVRVVGTDGKLIASWKPGCVPQAIAVGGQNVFVAGKGELVRLDLTGKVQQTLDIGAADLASMTASDKYVFLSLRQESGFGVDRFSHALADRKTIVTGLRGCCGNMDLATDGKSLFAAENARHRVARFDFEGKELSAFGESDREKIEAFGSCCNPMNICLSPKGEILTAETNPDRVKRYSADGKFIDLIGLFTRTKACSCVDLAISPQGNRVYVGDTTNQVVRVLVPRAAGASATPAPGGTAATPTPSGTAASSH